MPNINVNNPVCPVCGLHTTFNQNLASGAKQYRCRRHKPNYTCTDSDRPAGGQILGDRKMSQSERTAKWKERDPEGYRASEKRKRKPKK